MAMGRQAGGCNQDAACARRKRASGPIDVAVAALLLAAVRADRCWSSSDWCGSAGGSPLFGHERVGRGGRRFLCWKIRTMVRGRATRLDDVLRADPDRAAGVGARLQAHARSAGDAARAFLRLTSLDELPQLWNVLVGEMSLVGPRPVTAEELARYGASAPALPLGAPGADRDVAARRQERPPLRPPRGARSRLRDAAEHSPRLRRYSAGRRSRSCVAPAADRGDPSMTELKPFRSAEADRRGGQIVPAILCGGSGSRLWPVSRRDFAKQHVPILGGASPFQRTLARLAGGAFADPIVVSAAASRFLVADQAREAGARIEIALEPEARDTLAAVIARRLPRRAARPGGDRARDAVRPPDPRRRRLRGGGGAGGRGSRPTAASWSSASRRPVRPRPTATSSAAVRRADAFVVARFVEKPDAARAAELIARGCLWNAGMFCFRADAGLREIERLAPAGARRGPQRRSTRPSDDLGALRLGAGFAEAPKISFDHAVMERTDRALVVAAGFEWSDIGDWKAVWEQSPRDAAGVAREGKVFARDVTRQLPALGRPAALRARGRPDSPSSTPPTRCWSRRSSGRRRSRAWSPSSRPTGVAEARDAGAGASALGLVPDDRPRRRASGSSGSWCCRASSCRCRSTTTAPSTGSWCSGTAEVTRDGEVLLVRENESIYLPLGCVHRLANPGRIPGRDRRGADRRLPRGGRHRADRGRFRPRLSRAER